LALQLSPYHLLLPPATINTVLLLLPPHSLKHLLYLQPRQVMARQV
jgi:hypothetical protein